MLTQDDICNVELQAGPGSIFPKNASFYYCTFICIHGLTVDKLKEQVTNYHKSLFIKSDRPQGWFGLLVEKIKLKFKRPESSAVFVK